MTHIDVVCIDGNKIMFIMKHNGTLKYKLVNSEPNPNIYQQVMSEAYRPNGMNE
jgi:hypothetical protein